MLFMTVYSFAPQHRDAAITRFKATGGAPPAGVKLLGRWHDVAGGRGFTLSESNDAEAVMRWAMEWSDLLSFKISPVVDDAQFAKVVGA